MKFKSLLVLVFAITLFGTLSAQNSKVDDIFGQHGEIYFKFDKSNLDLNKLSRLVSLDNVSGNEVYAYANKREFTALMEQLDAWEILTKPGELIKNPKMLENVDVRQINDWDFYPTYDAYIDMMYQFATNHPDKCEVFSIGQTTENRELMMAKISSNVGTREAEPQFLYTGTMHGDETAGFVLFLRLIDYLLENYGIDPTATYLLDNAEIWINPAANPDGTYAGGNNTVNGATRYNANYVDLNRNYPDPEDGPHPDGQAWQPETLAFMQMAEENNFVMSANSHGGAEVLNYPWDTWPRLHPDTDWWINVCREYVDTVHLYSPSGYLTDLQNGITNGYAWYSTSGSRQDYMNYFQHCREITLELSGTKLLSPSQLPAHWDWNYRSLLNFIEQSTFGVNGIVTDAETGDPISAMISIEGHDEDSSMVFAEPMHGFYQRNLEEGIYDLTFSAPGKFPLTVEDVLVSRLSTVTLNVELDAGDLIPDFSASATMVALGSPVNFTDLSYGNPVSWEWTFEGGLPASATEQNPAGIIYNETGIYDVSLTITGNDGGTETILKEDYISVNAEFMMGNQTVTTCEGLFFDSGGDAGNYSNNEDFTMTFLPGNPTSVIIADFLSFNVEANSSCDYDWLKIYDGTSTSAPLIGIYCGTNSPGTIEAGNDEGALTFQFHSDYSVNKPGWKAAISCSWVPLLPIADFIADTTEVVEGEYVQFYDLTNNNPTSWVWVFEGGTPPGSSEQNPQIQYTTQGTFDVTLIVQNDFGSDTKVMYDYIHVDSTIGFGDLLDQGFSVYPNPIYDDLLNVVSPVVLSEIELVDMNGKSVLKQRVNTNEFSLQVQDINNGIYILNMKSAEGWKRTKISVIR